MTARPTDSLPVLRCSDTADFLAALPYLTGFTAANSVFVVCFLGSRSGPAVRIDLPVADDPVATMHLLDCVGGLARDIGAQHRTRVAVAVAIICDETFSTAGGPPWRSLARLLKQRLRRDGVEVRELCVRAADGWVSFLDPTPPLIGRPLSDIEQSRIISSGALVGAEAPVDLSRLGAIPVPRPARATAVARALEQHGRLPLPGSERVPPQCSEPGASVRRPPAWMQDAAASARRLRGEAELSPRATAQLILRLGYPGHWICIALGILTRPEFPLELVAEGGFDRFDLMPVDLDSDREAAHGASETSSDSAPVAGGAWSLFRLLAGICPEFTEQRRLGDIRGRMIGVLSEAPEEHRPGVFAFSAWIWWLSGNQTVARRHVEAGLSLDPHHELCLMVQRLISSPLYSRFVSSAAPRLHDGGAPSQSVPPRGAPRRCGPRPAPE